MDRSAQKIGKNKTEKIQIAERLQNIERERNQLKTKNTSLEAKEESRNNELKKSLEKKENAKNSLTETIKNLVGFHRREIKPEWWETFDRMDKTHDELEEDPECIGNCFLKSDKPEKVEKGYVFTYQFNDQDYKLKKDSTSWPPNRVAVIFTRFFFETQKNFKSKL